MFNAQQNKLTSPLHPFGVSLLFSQLTKLLIGSGLQGETESYTEGRIAVQIYEP